MNSMIKRAKFSADRKYRYSLERIWITRKPFVCFVGLNPSTADENLDDPTIRRCIRFSSDWGYGGLVMVNLFAFRSTNPKKLYLEDNPIGDENDKYLRLYSQHAGITVVAWGTNGEHMKRGENVIKLLTNPQWLTHTKGGHPGHPLYLKADLKPVPFSK